MPEYVIAYHGGKRPASKEEGQAHMTKWMAWSKGMGEAVVNPGWPVGPSKTVTPQGVEDNGGSNPLAGVTILQADTIEEVIELVKACPHLDLDGTIEVAEAMNMDM